MRLFLQGKNFLNVDLFVLSNKGCAILLVHSFQSKMIHLLTLTKCLKVQLGNALFMMVTVQLSNPLWCLNIVLVSLKIPHDYLNKWITINSFLTLSAEYFHIKIVYSNLICKVAFLFNVFCKMNQVKELNVYWCEVNYSHFSCSEL